MPIETDLIFKIRTSPSMVLALKEGRKLLIMKSDLPPLSAHSILQFNQSVAAAEAVGKRETPMAFPERSPRATTGYVFYRCRITGHRA